MAAIQNASIKMGAISLRHLYSVTHVSQFSKITIATYITQHPEASPAASTAAASINIQSKEPSSRDHHAESNPMRLSGAATCESFMSIATTYTQCTVSISCGCSDAERCRNARDKLNLIR